MGVPRADGDFGNCDPNNKKNYRTRCSALLKTTDENILIDTSPDLRQQLLRHKIKKINKVLFSHMHGDQTHGINDLRSFYINSRKQINVYADNDTSKYLKNSFSYIFKSYSKEYPATLICCSLSCADWSAAGGLSLGDCWSGDGSECIGTKEGRDVEVEVPVVVGGGTASVSGASGGAVPVGGACDGLAEEDAA